MAFVLGYWATQPVLVVEAKRASVEFKVNYGADLKRVGISPLLKANPGNHSWSGNRVTAFAINLISYITFKPLL